MKKLILKSVLLAAAMLALPMSANALTWTLSGVTFNGGGEAHGSFDYNAGTNAYSNWDLTAYNFQFTPSTSNLSAFIPGPAYVKFTDTDTGNFLNLSFLPRLTDNGGQVDIEQFQSSASVGALSASYFTAGSVTAISPIPEPETYALMLAGLAVVGAAARRRQAVNTGSKKAAP